MCSCGQPKPLTPAAQLKREPFIPITGALLPKETPICFVAMALFLRRLRSSTGMWTWTEPTSLGGTGDELLPGKVPENSSYLLMLLSLLASSINILSGMKILTQILSDYLRGIVLRALCG